MGRQISYLLADAGATVTLHDRDSATLAAAQEWCAQQWGARETDFTTHLNLGAAVAGAKLVLECIVEDLDAKRALFAQLGVLAPDAVLASNSSAMPASLWADTTPRPERLINAHFYVRPWERRVVELMTCGRTSHEVLTSTAELFESLQIRAFTLRAVSVGLLYNRIWAAIRREALSIVDEGVATPQEVDEIYRALDPAPSRGPFERMDAVGLDISHAIESFYATQRGTTVSPSLTARVRDGHLGAKTGRGFLDHATSEQRRISTTSKGHTP